MGKHEGLLSKKDLRNMMLGLRKDMSEEALGALSRLAQGNLLRQEAWKKAKTVALYKPTRNEVDTEALLDIAGIQCKTVFLPRVRSGRDKTMDFVICHGPQDMVKGAFGILEPTRRLPACVFTEPDKCPEGDHLIAPPPDIFIVPGVAFDRGGQRLGYGGGYYDRFLSSPLLREHSFFIGLAYSFQVVDSLPAESWDEPVNALCTDAGYEEFRS